MAAQQAEAAFADRTSRRRRWCSNAALRADEEGDLEVFRGAPASAARREPATALDAADRPRVQRFEATDAKLYRGVKRGDRAGAEQTRRGTPTSAADGVIDGDRALHRRANRDRAQADAASPAPSRRHATT
jgi:hypothetical protein